MAGKGHSKLKLHCMNIFLRPVIGKQKYTILQIYTQTQTHPDTETDTDTHTHVHRHTVSIIFDF